MNKCKSIFSLSLLIISAITTASCSDADLCYDVEHPHRTGLKVMFNWDETTTPPDSMFIIADRVFNSWKCGLKVDTETGYGKYLFNGPKENTPDTPSNTPSDNTENSDESNNPDGANSTPAKNSTEVQKEVKEFKILSGDYKFLAFNMDDTELDYSEVFNYMADTKNQIKLQDIYVSYKSYQKNDPALRRPTDDWVDYNPYAQYIQADMPAVFFDTIESKKIVYKQPAECAFSPKPLTQDIDIIFKIQKEGGVKLAVDSVIAEIAGIPHKINLSNGFVDITKTYKMLFKMNMENGSGNPIEEDNYTNKQIVCKKNINVTCIVRSSSSEMTVGPGILQVMIFVTATTNSNDTGGEYKFKKKIQGRINLCNTIDEAGLIEITDDGTHARRSKAHGTLNIKDILKIDGRNIIENQNENKIDRWVNTSDIIVDI